MAQIETVTLGGGCFWCLEAVYDRMAGVTSVESGYMGGKTVSPTYQQVCSGATGHVEVVQVQFDGEVTTFREILEVFFAIHDPTSWDRQGNDTGSQYRSVIFYHSETQREVAEDVVRGMQTSGLWRAPIVTEVRPAEQFYVAEDCHQDYFRNNPNQGYCAFVVRPKVEKFQAKFAEKVK